jgi:hypothetical protein
VRVSGAINKKGSHEIRLSIHRLPLPDSHVHHVARGKDAAKAHYRRAQHALEGWTVKYKPAIVTAWMIQSGIPVPEFEYRFHPARMWRFDLAWPTHRVYLEVDGGIWITGGHNRGAQILKDWEKRNTATALGWRGLWCQPKDLCTEEMAKQIKGALISEAVGGKW